MSWRRLATFPLGVKSPAVASEPGAAPLMLELSSGTDMSAVRAAASAKLDDVERRIRELQSVRRGLKTVIDACPGHGDPHQCPIIQSLSAGAPPAD